MLASTNSVQQIHKGRNFVVIRAGASDNTRIGIYGTGSCDLNALFACAPLIGGRMEGSCAILVEGNAATARSDILLQTLDDLPERTVRLLSERFELPPDHFRPRLFENTFSVQVKGTLEQFPKTIVVLSIGADLSRRVYRHREDGVLVDPGAAWLGRPMNQVLADLSAAPWFRDSFASIGRISLDDFANNFTRIIQTLKANGSHVLVFNYLNVEPRSTTHTYQFIREPLAIRRREFNLALVELSRNLDFGVVNVDRQLQRVGVRSAIDWGHPHPAHNLVIAEEVVRILGDLRVF